MIEAEVQRPPCTAHSAFDGEPNDVTMGNDGNRTAVRVPENLCAPGSSVA